MDDGKIKSRKRCMKKALAVSLAVITAFSVLPARPATVKAAKPYVSLRTTFKTLQTGQTNRMTLKNNTLGWKITKVSTKDRSIAMVYGKNESSFMIKGKAEGRTTVRAKLKTTARKKFSTKTVRCRVNVLGQEEASDPLDPSEAVVSTQAELEKALQGKNLKKLEIITDQPGKLVIPKGSYPNVELSVYAPAADIENNGQFQSITLKAIKPDTWIENAIGNAMRVLAGAARIIVNEGARLDRLNFASVNAKVSLEVNGSINELSISAKMELSITGKPEKPVNTIIEEGAEGTVLETSAPLDVTAHASASITFNEGAENSSVTMKSEKAKVNVKNNTYTTITVTKADGTVESIRSGRIDMSIPSYNSGSSNYTPPASDPVSPGAIVTGPALDPGASVVPGGVPGGVPGDSGSSILWGRSPLWTDFKDILGPVTTITITRDALSASVSMSAILTLTLNPDAVELDYNGYAKWKCKQLDDYRELTKVEAGLTVRFEMEPSDYASLADQAGPETYLQFCFEEYNQNHDTGPVYLTYYHKPVIDSYIDRMEKLELSVITITAPLEKHTDNLLHCDYNEKYITQTVPETPQQ